jgi:hypothetical protein
MTCSIRKAVQGDEQRICELFIEMLQTIYHTEDVREYFKDFNIEYLNEEIMTRYKLEKRLYRVCVRKDNK